MCFRRIGDLTGMRNLNSGTAFWETRTSVPKWPVVFQTIGNRNRMKYFSKLWSLICRIVAWGGLSTFGRLPRESVPGESEYRFQNSHRLSNRSKHSQGWRNFQKYKIWGVAFNNGPEPIPWNMGTTFRFELFVVFVLKNNFFKNGQLQCPTLELEHPQTRGDSAPCVQIWLKNIEKQKKF